MASDRHVHLHDTFSPVPASTYNLKEKLKSIFFEEAHYVYQTFRNVNSVALNGTLSITINGNEDTGVIEISEKTDRETTLDARITTSSMAAPLTEPAGYLGEERVTDFNVIGGISKLTMPFSPLPSKPKNFNKKLFEQITSLGHLELLRKYADIGSKTSTATSNTDESTQPPVVKRRDRNQDRESQPPSKEKEEEEEEEVGDWEEDEEGTEEEDKEDKKDVDYTPDLGEDAATIVDEEDQGENDKNDKDDVDGNDDAADNDDDTWTTTKRRSKRMKTVTRKAFSKPVIPKKKGRRTAAKLSLKIKLKQLTKTTKSKKVTMATAEMKAAKEQEQRRYEENDAGNLTCSSCHKQFHTKKSFKRHCDRHWKSFQCDQCGKPFSSMDSLFHHKKGLHSSTKPYSCEECGTTFNFHHSYKLHMRKHSGERPYQCPDCDKSYLTATHLKAHREAIHETGTQNTYVCDTCGKTFTYRNSLKTHQMIHTGDRPYKCSICEKGFVTRQALRTHKDSYHVQERNFQCDICFKYYKSEHLRNVHRRRHTSDVNRFMCDICGRQFMFKSNLDAHSFVHQDDRPFVCTICQKSFKCMSSLYTHQYTHKSTTPFKCSTCNKAFKTKNCLKAHEKRHNAEKNYMCSLCGACFPDKGGMTKHIRTIHAPQKQFVCKFCGKTGTRADNMRTHIKSHGKEAAELDASECILEVSASSVETSDDVKEITAKSMILSKGMRNKALNQSNRAAKVAEPTMYLPPEPSTVLPGLDAHSLITYRAPGTLAESASIYSAQRSPSHSIYQPPSPNSNNYQPQSPSNNNYQPSSPSNNNYQLQSPSNNNYQPQSPSNNNYQPQSPNNNYQPTLSPQNFPQLTSPHVHGSVPIGINSGPHHDLESLEAHVGQGQLLMPLTDPSQMGVMERSLLSSGIAMSVHGQKHQHGPAVFPPIQTHSVEQGRNDI